MFEGSIARIDAAGAGVVDAPLSRSLLAFVRDLTGYVCEPNESIARAALCSPFSGVPNVDARALRAIAGERGSVAATIERGRVAMPHESTVAARRFASALARLRSAYRAQGATAGEHVAAIRLAFDLDAMLSEQEHYTFATMCEVTARIDRERAASVAWEASDLLRELHTIAVREDLARPRPAPQRRPLGECEPEAARVVARSPGHFSASSLAMFAECERRWYYRYVCKAVEDRGSSASYYGTAFHLALEHFHKEFPRAGDAARDVLERKLDAHLLFAFECNRAGFETTVEYELQLRRAKRTGRRYLDWFIARSLQHPFSVVGTEAKVDLELGGYTFVGVIDRLDRDDETAGVTVIDYKTGSIAESAAEYRANVAAFVDFQLPFYYWARTAAGDRVTRLALVPLKDSSLEVRPIELEVVQVAVPPARSSWDSAASGTIGIDELERARVKMIELAATLADGPLERFPVTTDPAACGYCAYKVACRERPLPREDRFGR